MLIFFAEVNQSLRKSENKNVYPAQKHIWALKHGDRSPIISHPLKLTTFGRNVVITQINSGRSPKNPKCLKHLARWKRLAILDSTDINTVDQCTRSYSILVVVVFGRTYWDYSLSNSSLTLFLNSNFYILFCCFYRIFSKHF